MVDRLDRGTVGAASGAAAGAAAGRSRRTAAAAVRRTVRSRQSSCRSCRPGAKDLGRSDDHMTERMPAVNVGLLDGHLAWRQHDGGHTDGPNWKYFIPWANRFLKHTPSAADPSQGGRGGA